MVFKWFFKWFLNGFLNGVSLYCSSWRHVLVGIVRFDSPVPSWVDRAKNCNSGSPSIPLLDGGRKLPRVGRDAPNELDRAHNCLRFFLGSPSRCPAKCGLILGEEAFLSELSN